MRASKPAKARAKTTPATSTERARWLERYPRRARRLHGAVYLLTFVLLATGWWLWLGREGEPSPLATLLGRTDVDIHKAAGWLLAALGVTALALGWRGAASLFAESFRWRRTELGWFKRWPGALLTGRFGRHEGRFDPGQRIANLLMVGGLIALLLSGSGLVLVRGGSLFVWLARIHLWATYLVTPVILGHVVLAAGLLPGYRGTWRAMHGRGRLHESTARRLWPGWTERALLPRERGRRDDPKEERSFGAR